LVDILNNDLEKAKKAKRLILSANNDVKLLREFLMNNHFMITSEVMVYDYKYYEILVAEYTSKNVNYTELELKYGPYLLKEKSADFINQHF
jgi:tRNA (adenine22-N1)-methyltransferase